MLNIKATAELLSQAILGVERAIEFYAENEGHCDDEEQAEVERERLEFLLDDLVGAYDGYKGALKPAIFETNDRTYVKTPFIVRKKIDRKPEYEDIAMFLWREDAQKFAEQLEEDSK